MIYIPKNGESKGCVEIHQNNKGNNVYYWWITDELLIMIISDPNDVYSTNLYKIGRGVIIPCAEIACQATPQLRYNKLLNKWVCTCPSSQIKNDDKDEIEMMKNHLSDFKEDPVQAITDWNISMAKAQIVINKDILKIYENNKD